MIEFNQSTTIAVSQNLLLLLLLFELSCEYNQLKSLNVSNKSSFIELWYYSNEISCIKVSENQLDNDSSNWKKDEVISGLSFNKLSK